MAGKLVRMDPLVKLCRVSELSQTDLAERQALATAVYPPAEWADWPGYQIEWSATDWCVRIWDADGALVSYLGALTRQATHDGRPIEIGGVGGVKTHPAARRHGYAALGLQRAGEFFREQPGVEFALLVCDPKLMPYYARLGWREFTGRLLVRQHGEVAEFTFGRAMVRDVQATAPTTGTIDLCGPPW